MRFILSTQVDYLHFHLEYHRQQPNTEGEPFFSSLRQSLFHTVIHTSPS